MPATRAEPCRAEERGQDPNCSRLPGAVRPEQAVDGPGVDLEVDSAEGLDVAVALAELARFDRDICGHASSRDQAAEISSTSRPAEPFLREVAFNRRWPRGRARGARARAATWDDQEMACARYDLEARVGSRDFHQRPCRGSASGIPRAVEQERLRRRPRPGLEPPRLQAVPGDVGGQPVRALDERHPQHLAEAARGLPASAARPRRPGLLRGARAPRARAGRPGRASRGAPRARRGTSGGGRAARARSAARPRSTAPRPRAPGSRSRPRGRRGRGGVRPARARRGRRPTSRPRRRARRSCRRARWRGRRRLRPPSTIVPAATGDEPPYPGRSIESSVTSAPASRRDPDRSSRRPARCGRGRRSARGRRAMPPLGARRRASSCGGRRPADPTLEHETHARH